MLDAEAKNPDLLDWVIKQVGKDELSGRVVREWVGRWHTLHEAKRKEKIEAVKAKEAKAETLPAKRKARQELEELGTPMPKARTQPGHDRRTQSQLARDSNLLDIDAEVETVTKTFRKNLAALQELGDDINPDYVDALVEHHKQAAEVAMQVVDLLNPQRPLRGHQRRSSLMLSVIEGGGGGKRGRPPGPQAFRPHPLSTLLWNAIYPEGQRALKTIASRMTKAAGYEVTPAAAHCVITHVRKYAYDYGWTVPAVQKGRGLNCKYLPALVDPNDPTTMITANESDDHLDSVRAGTISSLRNMATEAERTGTALEIFAAAPQLTRSEKRMLNNAASMSLAAGEMIESVLKRSSNHPSGAPAPEGFSCRAIAPRSRKSNDAMTHPVTSTVSPTHARACDNIVDVTDTSRLRLEICSGNRINL